MGFEHSNTFVNLKKQDKRGQTVRRGGATMGEIMINYKEERIWTNW